MAMTEWMKRAFSVTFLGLASMAAQGQTAQIVGTISDASGARAPEAQVTAKEVDTGRSAHCYFQCGRLLYGSTANAG